MGLSERRIPVWSRAHKRPRRRRKRRRVGPPIPGHVRERASLRPTASARLPRGDIRGRKLGLSNWSPSHGIWRVPAALRSGLGELCHRQRTDATRLPIAAAQLRCLLARLRHPRRCVSRGHGSAGPAHSIVNDARFVPRSSVFARGFLARAFGLAEANLRRRFLPAQILARFCDRWMRATVMTRRYIDDRVWRNLAVALWSSNFRCPAHLRRILDGYQA
jgi:hypothetical protein